MEARTAPHALHRWIHDTHPRLLTQVAKVDSERRPHDIVTYTFPDDPK